ncbi:MULTISPECIES: substrate-binding periplasmic protein [Pseudoalteromonas]|uniref:Transporter substrate-binding domain-containing protein n=1 Tax=Pseudoalteromonas haloplanktis TaxID=228 RepID=A0ABU1BFX2_PSEHA|nr:MULTISPECIES: transporter substrate-binding domain-containing protein [Pseudoalteromonas]MDQ9093245.1 transporter substrate-binding domain-containing protein [Pseudoalteromonas haloplanktis]
MAKWCCFLFIIISSQSVAKLNIVTEHFPPAQYLDENNQLVGDIADKVRRVLDASALDYAISVNGWSTAFNMALRDPQTCIFSMTRSISRENKFVWIAKLAELDAYLYALNSKNIAITSLEQAKQYRIAVLKDNYSHHYLLSQGFEEGKNLMLMSSFDNIFQIVQNRKNSIDMVVLPEQRAQYEQAKGDMADKLLPVLRLDLEQPGLYFACNKQLDNPTKTRLSSAFSTYQ